MTPIMCSTSVGFSPASTSSSKSSIGCAASARASSSRFLPAMVRCDRQHRGAILQAGDGDRFARRFARAAPSGRFSRPKQAPTVQFSSTVILVSGCTI